MGWKYRKSIKIAPGVRLNLGKKSRSITVGGKFHRATFSSTGRVTKSTSIPGTGLHHTTTVRSGRKQTTNNARYIDDTPKYSPTTYKVCGTILQVLSVLLFAMSLALLTVSGIGIVFVIFAALLFFVGRNYRKIANMPEEEIEEEPEQ